MEKRQLKFWRFMQQFITRGTAGALLFALARAVVDDLDEVSPSLAEIDVGYTVLMLIRYGSAIWFMVYLFLSAASNELEEPAAATVHTETKFDVIQIALVLLAVGLLGFLLPSSSVYFGVTGIVIAAIGLVSLYYFRDSDGLRHVRCRAFGLGLFYAVVAIPDAIPNEIIAGPLILLYVLVLKPFARSVYSSRTSASPPPVTA